MQPDKLFKEALFGGFRKKEVIEFIKTRENELVGYIEEAEIKNKDLTAENESLKNQLQEILEAIEESETNQEAESEELTSIKALYQEKEKENGKLKAELDQTQKELANVKKEIESQIVQQFSKTSVASSDDLNKILDRYNNQISGFKFSVYSTGNSAIKSLLLVEEELKKLVKSFEKIDKQFFQIESENFERSKDQD